MLLQLVAAATDVAAFTRAIKYVVSHFDKVAFRTATKPTKGEREVLRRNALSFDVRRGHPIRPDHPIRRRFDQKFVVTMVVPTGQAFELADELGWTPNYIEPAINAIAGGWQEALGVHYFLDDTFLQGWHGKQQLIRYSPGPLGADDPCATTYTGQRGANRRFAWYSHQLCKITGEPCLHLESRHQGLDACRRVGIYTPADFLTFDARAHWQRNLACYVIDFAHLGRSHLNEIEGTRRHKPRVNIGRTGFAYDQDAATGRVLFRVLSVHKHQQMRSMQRFIDQHGRGAFLRRLDVSALLPSINYIPETLKLNNPMILKGNIPLNHHQNNLYPDSHPAPAFSGENRPPTHNLPSHLHGEPTSCG